MTRRSPSVVWLATNRFSGANVSYDANGNIQYAGSVDANYRFDIENRMVMQWNPSTVTSESNSYGPDSLRVWKRRTDGTEQVTFYGLRGERMDMYQPISSSSGVLAGGVALLYFAGRPLWYGADRLGSNRADSPNMQGQTISHTYFPYGEEYTTTTQDTEKFGTYYRDSTTALDYARNRFYSNRLARFLTADSYRASGGPADPGSWNRYAYVVGDPVNLIDPQGTTFCFVNPTTGAIESCYDSTDVNASIGGDYVGGGRTRPPGTRIPADPLAYTAQQAWALARGYQLAVKRGFLTNCQALAGFAQDAADQNTSTNQFVNNFGALTPHGGSSIAGIAWSSDPVYLNTGQSSGYLNKYQNTLPDKPGTGWNGDQGHHFAGFFEFGYKYGAAGGAVAAFATEYWQGLESGILNAGDVALGEAAAKMGADLKAGKISMSDIASAILSTLCAH